MHFFDILSSCTSCTPNIQCNHCPYTHWYHVASSPNVVHTYACIHHTALHTIDANVVSLLWITSWIAVFVIDSWHIEVDIAVWGGVYHFGCAVSRITRQNSVWYLRWEVRMSDDTILQATVGNTGYSWSWAWLIIQCRTWVTILIWPGVQPLWRWHQKFRKFDVQSLEWPVTRRTCSNVQWALKLVSLMGTNITLSNDIQRPLWPMIRNSIHSSCDCNWTSGHMSTVLWDGLFMYSKFIQMSCIPCISELILNNHYILHPICIYHQSSDLTWLILLVVQNTYWYLIIDLSLYFFH